MATDPMTPSLSAMLEEVETAPKDTPWRIATTDSDFIVWSAADKIIYRAHASEIILWERIVSAVNAAPVLAAEVKRLQVMIDTATRNTTAVAEVVVRSGYKGDNLVEAVVALQADRDRLERLYHAASAADECNECGGDVMDSPTCIDCAKSENDSRLKADADLKDLRTAASALVETMRREAEGLGEAASEHDNYGRISDARLVRAGAAAVARSAQSLAALLGEGT